MIYKACKPVYINGFFVPLQSNIFLPKSLSYYFDTELYVIFYNFSITTIFIRNIFSSSPVLSLQVLNQDLCNVGLDIFLITMKSLEPVHILHILYHHSITVVHFMLYNLGCITTELAVFRRKIFIQIIHFYFFVSCAITNSIQ